MKSVIPLAIALLWSTGAYSQPATFSTSSGRLEIPSLTVDGRVALTDVELLISDEKEPTFTLVDYERNPVADTKPREVQLKFGDSFALRPDQSIRFIAVLGESRCPSDVLCITSGEVTVILRLVETDLIGNTRRTDFGLTLLGTDISSFEHQGVYFRLVEALPYPVSTEQADEEDYSITLEYQSVPFKN